MPVDPSFAIVLAGQSLAATPSLGSLVEDLDRHLTPEAAVEPAVNHRHATLSDFLE